jgi:hypothetical protein
MTAEKPPVEIQRIAVQVGGACQGVPTPILKPDAADLERAAMIKRQRAINGIEVEVRDPVTRKTFITVIELIPPAFQRFLVAKPPWAAKDEFGRRCPIVSREVIPDEVG